MKELENMERHDMPFICTWNIGYRYEDSDGVFANIFIRDAMLFGREMGSDPWVFYFDLNENMTEDEAHDSAAWQALKKLELQNIYTLIRMTRNPTDPGYYDKELNGGWIYVLTRRIVSK